MKVEVETRFNIGDVVRSIGAEPGAWSNAFVAFGARRLETRFIVVGVFIDVCPVGAQVAYSVRGASADGSVFGDPLKLNESELAPSEPFRRNAGGKEEAKA